MMTLIFSFFSNYLIEFMGGVFLLGLLFRWLAYKSSKVDEIYYTSFSRDIELNIEKDKDKEVPIQKAETYLIDILNRVSRRLPNRLLRFSSMKKVIDNNNQVNYDRDDDQQRLVSLREYVTGKKGLISSIQSESSVFSCKTRPDFSDLTNRIMQEDKRWSTLFNHIPIDGVSRMIDILPGLFIIFGVFGTFLGIAMALPEIAKIDFSNLDGSGEILNQFVLKVTFSMNTSIAGIIFSVMLTVLNTLFPIKARRFKIFKKVENSLQLLWYHIHDTSNNKTTIEDILPELVVTLKELRNDINSKKKIG